MVASKYLRYLTLSPHIMLYTYMNAILLTYVLPPKDIELTYVFLSLLGYQLNIYSTYSSSSSLSSFLSKILLLGEKKTKNEEEFKLEENRKINQTIKKRNDKPHSDIYADSGNISSVFRRRNCVTCHRETSTLVTFLSCYKKKSTPSQTTLCHC